MSKEIAKDLGAAPELLTKPEDRMGSANMGDTTGTELGNSFWDIENILMPEDGRRSASVVGSGEGGGRAR